MSTKLQRLIQLLTARATAEQAIENASEMLARFENGISEQVQMAAIPAQSGKPEGISEEQYNDAMSRHAFIQLDCNLVKEIVEAQLHAAKQKLVDIDAKIETLDV